MDSYLFVMQTRAWHLWTLGWFSCSLPLLSLSRFAIEAPYPMLFDGPRNRRFRINILIFRSDYLFDQPYNLL